MDLFANYIDAIQDNYPDFVVHSITPYRGGQHCLAFTLNDAFIFRFPRYEGDWSSFEGELRILDRLQGQVPIPIPKPQYWRASGSGAQPFMGYRRLPGKPLRRDIVAGLRDNDRKNLLADQLGAFLVALHRPETADAVEPNGCAVDTLARYSALFCEVQEKLFPHMRPESQRATSERFLAFLGNEHNFVYTPCLRHGDFGPTNILVADDHSTITAILDFGNAGLSDPAYDFAGVLCYGTDFLERVGANYPDFETLRSRALFYNATFGLQEALFTLEHGNMVEFESVMKGLR